MFFASKFLLQPERLQLSGVHVHAVGGDLIGFDRQERLAFPDRLALFDVNLFDRAPSRHEDLRRAFRRGEIADRRLFARVLREKQKADQQGDDGH